MLNRIVYVLRNNRKNINFSYYKPGDQVSLVVQTGLLPGETPIGLFFYQNYLCYFNTTLDTIFISSSVTPNPETWNEPDYDEIYSDPAAQAAPTLSDAGFESPSVGVGNYQAFQYAPAGTPWAFAGEAGVAGNGSGFTDGNPDAPEGTQVGFLQRTGAFSQDVPGWAAGTYQVSFNAAQRGNYQASQQDFQVLVDGKVVGTFTPTGTGYAPYTTVAFTVAAGTHTVAFQGLDSAGGDNTAFIDNVQLTQTH
jgi:hypothetical protein